MFYLENEAYTDTDEQLQCEGNQQCNESTSDNIDAHIEGDSSK